MNRDLQEYARYMVARTLNDLKGQVFSGPELEEALVHTADQTATFIYATNAQNFAAHCWDECQELSQDMAETGLEYDIVTSPEVYGQAVAQNAIRDVVYSSETFEGLADNDKTVEIDDALIALFTKEMSLDDYRVIDGKDPEDRLVDDYKLDTELSFADQSFRKYIDGYISDRLDYLRGESVYGCDLASKLTEYDNVNGSVFCSTYKAEEFIKKFWDEADQTVETLKNDYGFSDEDFMNKFDPLTNAEAFQFCMVDKGVHDVLGRSSYVNDHYDETIELNDMTVAYIKEELGIRAKLEKGAALEIPDDEKYENHYFLTDAGNVLEWRHDDFPLEPDPADFELDNESQAELQRRQEAYDNDEVFVPTVYNKAGEELDVDVTNYGLEVNPGSHELVEYLGKYSDIEQCLEYNRTAINEQAAAKEAQEKLSKPKNRGL